MRERITMNIKEKRLKKGWSRQKLADKLGVTSRTIINYENNYYKIPKPVLMALASVLK
jgi:transcriptional regulator with XRE-family HTH domain